MTLTFLSPSVICTPGSSVSTGVLESWDRLSTPNPILKSQFWHTLSDVHMYIIDYDANPCCGRYNAVIFNAEPFLLTKLLHRIQLAIFPCQDQVNNCPVADERSMNILARMFITMDLFCCPIFTPRQILSKSVFHYYYYSFYCYCCSYNYYQLTIINDRRKL